MTGKKSGFLRFVFSLLPGAGEMYMGFMKMGISLMGMFFVIVALASFLEVGPLILIAVIAWFYSFFHVHNLAAMPDEEFYAVEDDYLIHLSDLSRHGEQIKNNYRNIIAVILIIVGVVYLWRGIFRMLHNYFPGLWQVYDIVGNRLPKIVVAIGIIALGIYMIRGKKQQLDEEESGV